MNDNRKAEISRRFEIFLSCPDDLSAKRLFEEIQKYRAEIAYKELKPHHRNFLMLRFGIKSKSALRAKALAGVARFRGDGVAEKGEREILDWLGVNYEQAKQARKEWRLQCSRS